jgi:luciferase-like monooxygenase
VNVLHKSLCQRLQDLGIEVRAWPGRDDGFASLIFNGKDFAHFHTWSEIDIRLGKETIKREHLTHPANSRVHPGRARNSPWHEMKILSAADVDEAVRLVKIAVAGMKP